MLLRHWLEQISHRCFKIVRPAKRKPTACSRRRRFDVPAVAEVLEDRVLLAAASFNPSTFVLTIDYTSTGTTAESVTITNNSGTLNITGDVTGDTALFQQAVQRIVVTDSGGSNNQTLLVTGSAFTLEDGLSSTDVENATLNATIGLVASNAEVSATTISVGNNATVITEGDGAIMLNASRNVVIDSGNLSVRDGDLTIAANQTSMGTGSFDGVRIQGGSVIESTGTGAGAGQITITGTGGTAASVNDGVQIQDANTKITSISGNVTITGNGGGNGTGSSNVGVLVTTGGAVESTGTGAGAASITITGTGGSGTSSNMGVRLESANSRVTAVDGDIAITGTGGNGSSSGNHGVIATTGGVVESTGTSADAATITITGTGGNGTSDNTGVRIQVSGSKVAAVAGDISIIGTGGNGSADTNHGVILATGGNVESTGTGANAAVIRITGTGGDGRSRNVGVLIQDAGSMVTAVDGDVHITGTGGDGSGSSNIGVTLDSGSVVESTGTGMDAAKISITGTGGSGTSQNVGVGIQNSDTKVTAVDGDITINGTGGNGSANLNDGVAILARGVVESTGTGVNAATITINGTGGDGTNTNTGVTIEFSGSKVTAVDGDITITGNGGAGSEGMNHGVFVNQSGVVESTGTGVNAAAITINGTAGNGTNDNAGVRIEDANSKVAAVNGTISVTGTGNGSGNNNHGVFVTDAGVVESTGTGMNAGMVTVTGTAAAAEDINRGVYVIRNGSAIRSAGGGVTVIGTGGSNGNDTSSFNQGVVLLDQGVIEDTAGGTVTVTGVGGNGGDVNYGVVAEQGTAIRSNNGNLSVTGTGGSNGNAGSTENRGVNLDTGGIIESTGTGAVSVTGTGGNGEDNNFGVKVDGGANSAIRSASGGVTVTGTGGSNGQAGSVGNYGIFVESGGVIEATASGAVTVIGTAGNGTTDNVGVRIEDANSKVAAVDGDITIMGTGGDGTGGINFGVLVLDGAAVESTGSGVNAATISITGTGGDGAAEDIGVALIGADSKVAADTGDINITGSGGNGANGVAVSSTSPGFSTSGSLVVTGASSPIATDNGATTLSQFNGQTITLNGTVSPGGSLAGELSATGAFTLADDDMLQINLNGATPFTQFDQVTVTGTVTLGGAALDVQRLMSFNPNTGDSFILIDNDGTDAVTGTFAQSSFSADGVDYVVRYDGGDGNDVVLVVAIPTNLVVDNPGDTDDGDFSAGEFTLREAVWLANTLDDANTITFAPALATGTITLGGTELDISEDVTITGLGATQLTINANMASRIFDVVTGTTASISGLRLIGGSATGSGADGDGGAIRNLGTLTVTDSVIAANVAQRNGGAIASAINLTVANTLILFNVAGNDSGAIDAFGTTTVTNSTISANGALGRGGAIYNDGTLTVTNSTLSGNEAQLVGGAIRNARGMVTVVNSTIALNRADSDGNSTGSGGGIATFDDNTTFTTLYNTLVIGNVAGAMGSDTPDDLAEKAVEAGSSNNIVSEDADDKLPNNNANQVVADASTVIDTNLADNGGTSLTHKLRLGSPAINAGNNSRATNNLTPAGTVLATDQRGTGFNRIVGGMVDIGAFELESLASITIADVSASEATGMLTFTVSRSGNTDGPSSMTYTVSNGTTTNNDFTGGTLPTGTVNFADGETSKTITVQVVNDNLFETDETFTVMLSNPTSGTTIADTTATGTIQNDDIVSDLRVSKTDGDVTNVFGSLIVYTITVDNDGSGASGVTLTETLANNVQFNAAASTAGWTETAPGSGTFTFNVGNLTAGQQTNVLFAVKVETTNSGTAQTTNTVSVTDNGANSADINPGNNTASDTTNLIAPISTVVASPFNASLINGTFTELHSGNFDAVRTAGPRADADDLFFWDPVSGVNRIIFGDNTFQTNSIPPSLINGGDFTVVVSGNFDNADGEDLFFWNPVTGRNRLIRLSGPTGMVAADFETNIVEPTAINGNDFTQIVAGNFDNGGAADLFFWNPRTGRNRMIHTMPSTSSDTQSSFQTNVIPANQINGNDFQRVDVGQFVAGGPEELFFLNLSSGRNRSVSFTVDTPGSISSFDGSQTNRIGGTQLNGNAFSQVAVGDFNNDDLDDVFAWDPRTGANRVGLTDVNPNQLSQVFSNLVDPSQINGNDFSVLISRSAGEGQTVGDDELFFWNPVTGRNRQAEA